MSISSIGLSGMRAAQKQLDTSAHNVANVQTQGFQHQAVALAAQGGSDGVTAQTVQEAPARAERDADFDRLTEDKVTQHMSVYSFAANLRSVETEDRMLGALLDTRA